MRRALAPLAAALILGALCGTARGAILPPLPPLSSTPQLGWEANGAVTAVAARGNVVFVGGGFTHLGPPATGRSAVVSATSGVPRYGLPRVDGDVLAVTGDGAGGWFIGGRFQTAGGVSCPRLAHVRADLTVDPAFCPRPGQLATEEVGGPNNGPAEVRVLLRSGDVLYVGGTFRTIGFDPQSGPLRRTHLAALSTANGELLPWNPGPIRRDDGTIPTTQGPASDGIPTGVNTLALSGTSLYVGGAFSSVDGTARKSLAAVSTADASLLAFDARIARAIDGPGNQFTEGSSRPVFALAISGDFVFAGGDFDLVNGVRRSSLAKINRTTGALITDWNAQALPGAGVVNGRVLALRASGFFLYVGGEFGRVQRIGPPSGSSDLTASGPNVAAVTRTTGVVRSWVGGADGPVRALAFTGTDVLLGGAFGTVAGLARPGAARVSRAGTSSPGAVQSWSPRAGFTCASASDCLGVSALFASGGDVYLGGGFSHVGGADRAGLAAIDLTTGEATSWNAALEGGARSVSALAVRDTTLYVAGDFTSAGGQPRAGLAGLSTASAAATGWQPAALGVAPPPGLLSGPAGIHLLGRETAVGDAAVPAVATDPVTGAATPWTPAVAGTAFIVPAERGIRAAAAFGDTLFLGGSFATIGGQARPQIGSVSATTGAVTGWAPGGVGFGTVRALAVRLIDAGVRLAYIGGDFTQVAGQSRAKLAAIDADTGALSSWSPGALSPSGAKIAAILSAGSDIVVGGTFSGVAGEDRRGLALLSPTPPAALRDFDARLDGTVDALGSAGTGAKLVVGGTFSRVGTRSQTNIAIFPREPDVASSGARVSRTGRWQASVRCPRGTAGGCRLRARLRELATARRRVIGVAVARVRAGRVVRLRFPISRAGLALLRARGRVPVRVEISSRDRIGNRTSGRRAFVLTRQR